MACGYDISGLSGGVCPECGTTARGSLADPATVHARLIRLLRWAEVRHWLRRLMRTVGASLYIAAAVFWIGTVHPVLFRVVAFCRRGRIR